MEKYDLEFQLYEIKLLKESLSLLKQYEYQSKCKWELQPNGIYYYTDNKRVRQINFIINSIDRQLNGKN